MGNTWEAYFGILPGCLDIFTLSYRWFGCAWMVDGSLTVIIGFWFADSQYEVEKMSKRDGQLQKACLANANEVKEMYDEIRRQQALQDWEKRSRLKWMTVFRNPWRSVKSGWYIIRSRKEFPYYVSAIYKGRCFAWIEHVSVCENEDDLHSFIKKVNQHHQIQLETLLTN